MSCAASLAAAHTSAADRWGAADGSAWTLARLRVEASTDRTLEVAAIC